MAIVIEKKTPKTMPKLGPDSAGARLTPRQYDRADFEEGWRYELIAGRLFVSPIPSEQERDPNGELEYMLRSYRDTHPDGKALDKTLAEHTVVTKLNRRRVDRAIWCGLGRVPRKGETPSVTVEFVSPGKRNRQRDYDEKRDEYMAINVQEYWIIDRFERTMTVFAKGKSNRIRKRVIKEGQVYTTPLLPGFELPLARLLEIADQWEEQSSK